MLSITTSNKTVELTDLTHTTVTGNGVFDVLMRSVKAHLEQEWTAGRIKGTEYSTVYLSALQTTLQTALQFVLSQEKTNQEIELVKAQVEVQKQQASNLALEAENIPKQGLLLDAQKDKTNAEKLFVDQKTITEKANTDATVIGTGSIIAKQNLVLDGQVDGFKRDAEQKAAKIVADYMSIRTTAMNDLGEPTYNMFSDGNIGAIMNKLKLGIGVTTVVEPPPPPPPAP